MSKIDTRRTVGLFGATSVGVGAIVGGGILALAGTAFVETGAGAVLAFALNGLIALGTAASFAELASAFPRSGGSYAFARQVLSVGAAFCVGWVAWFASIVAGVLYALGFAAFLEGGALAVLGEAAPAWLAHPAAVPAGAAAATLVCAAIVARAGGGGGVLVNVAKVLVFAVVIGGGIWVWSRERPPALERLTPLLPEGGLGLLRAMGFTFIALQGFDLIAAISGEVREPRRNLPRSMFLALGIALALYLPILIVVPVLGVPAGTSIQALAQGDVATLVPAAVGNFLGPRGYWLVLVAGVLSMFSALLANLYAASRIAQAMARDRTLPASLARVHAGLGTPLVAVAVTAVIALGMLLIVRDLATAGAAASLIFLLTFTLANVLSVVARKRKPRHGGYRLPLWPALPILSALCCGGLALFQGAVVPSAGLAAATWLALGGLIYITLFARYARVQDAVQETVDADLLELRGRSPLVLVPTDDTTDAGVLALFAACMTPPRVGRVLLLNIMPPLREQVPDEFDLYLYHASGLTRASMSAAVHAGARTEALTTVGGDRWKEIERVARTHHCATVLLGMRELSDADLRGHLEGLASSLGCNVVLFRVPPGWRPEDVRRVVVPIRGSGAHSSLRARLLASLRHRAAPEMEVVYLLVLPTSTSEQERVRRERAYTREMRLESEIPGVVRAVRSDDVSAAIVEAAEESDLTILGLGRQGRAGRIFGGVTRKVIASTRSATLVISQPG